MKYRTTTTRAKKIRIGRKISGAIVLGCIVLICICCVFIVINDSLSTPRYKRRGVEITKEKLNQTTYSEAIIEISF